MSKLTHFTKDGTPRMVNVADKAITKRKAIARGYISMHQDTLKLIEAQGHKKGNVIEVAQLAGIMGAKKTPELIPMCHPLGLSHAHVSISVVKDGLEITAECEVSGQTGVEMEALTAVAVAALTVYDMCKSADRSMVIKDICLIHKSGGKSGEWNRDNEN